MSEPVPEFPLAKRLACAVIALGQWERVADKPCLVVLPRQEGQEKLEAVMLGELLLDAGEAILAAEPQAKYDPLLETPRERFLDLVRDAAKELQASATPRPRLVRPNGAPLR